MRVKVLGSIKYTMFKDVKTCRQLAWSAKLDSTFVTRVVVLRHTIN